VRHRCALCGVVQSQEVLRSKRSVMGWKLRFLVMQPARGILGAKEPSAQEADVAVDDEVRVEECVRRKIVVLWVEIADRPPKTSLSTEERVAFLRLVKSIRAYTVGLQVRDACGRRAPPTSCVSLAAQLMQIAPRTAERINSDFQQRKCVPDITGPLP
jgi:hypothetical protein